MGIRFEGSEFEPVWDKLLEDFEVHAPVRRLGRGHFSDTDLITYASVNAFTEIVFDKKSTFSPKEVVLPITQRFFYFTEDSFQECVPQQSKPLLLFLRACDINGIDRLDTIFLGNGPRDNYYERLRRRIKFALIECSQSFDNCFCVAMQANNTNNYSLALKVFNGCIELQVQDPSLAKYFSGKGKSCNYKPSFIEKDTQEVNVPSITEMPKRLYDHPLWAEYKQRCIACGRCNTTCISCSCFSTQDIFYEANPRCGERQRVWAGCHIDGFTSMAGGHEVRTDNGARMRFKTFHKIYDFQKRFNKGHMCVGCGRCDDNCPEYISFANCINKVSAALNE